MYAAIDLTKSYIGLSIFLSKSRLTDYWACDYYQGMLYRSRTGKIFQSNGLVPYKYISI